MAESVDLAVDPPVSRVRVLLSESDDKYPDLRFDWWTAAFRSGWLGPVSGDKSAAPSDDRVWSDDEEHLGETPAVEHAGQHREDGPGGLGELGAFDLALEHDELVTQREDFDVALIPGGEHPSEP